jgi:hypothetical protein
MRDGAVYQAPSLSAIVSSKLRMSIHNLRAALRLAKSVQEAEVAEASGAIGWFRAIKFSASGVPCAYSASVDAAFGI